MDLFQKVIDYFRSSKAELQKVTWPSKQDTVRYSTLVIGASIGLALFFAVLDKGLITTVKWVIARRPAPTVQQTPPTTVPTTQPLDVSNVLTATGSNAGTIQVVPPPATTTKK